MMVLGYCHSVLEYLLWAAVCMESSVPLMASKYLCVRVNVYMAVCQCYCDLHCPKQAEFFSRRGLDKVLELAKLESSSDFQPTLASEQVYREATVQLGVMVFKQTVFVIQKKLKHSFRHKLRPTLKDSLHIPPPRSPSEKLLCDMFTGQSAQFLAILEALSDGYQRPLRQRRTPSPSDVDHEMIARVYQVSVCLSPKHMDSLTLCMLQDVSHSAAMQSVL